MGASQLDSRQPNLLIAGAARSGTTALSESLARHPDICMSSPKEVHFLTHSGAAPSYTGPGDEVMMSKLIHDPDQFARLFDGATQRYCAEGSVTTLYWPDRSIPSIRQYCAADTKLICLLRHPARRAHSAYLYLRSRGYEDAPTFEEGLALEEQRIAAGYHHMWHYEAVSRYEQQLPQLAEAFGDRLHVMVFEEFRADPVTELGRLCRFLDIDFEPSMLIESDINRGGEAKSELFARVLSAARSQPLIRETTVRLVPRVLRDRVRARNLRRPSVDPTTLSQLNEAFAAAVQATESVIGRPISAWSNEADDPGPSAQA